MTWFDVDGALIDPKTLEYSQARQVRDALNWYPLAELIEVRARKTDAGREEMLIVDVEPELPQDLTYQINSVERLALTFRKNEQHRPDIAALRKDFPRVPHLNWTPAGDPKELCLYEQSWSEVRLCWTAAGFLRDLLHWLSRTAKGELHASDQPLEPFLFESANAVLFPETVFDDTATDKVFASLVVQELPGFPYTLKLQEVDEEQLLDGPRMYCAATVGTPTAQDAMRDCPRNLIELVSLLDDVGIDLWKLLSSRVMLWYSRQPRPREQDGVVLLLKLPRLREAGGPVDSVQHLAFHLYPITVLSMATGRVGTTGVGQPFLPLVNGEIDESLAELVSVVPMRAIQSLDRLSARRVSGLQAPEDEPRVVLVGAGALGSQIHEHLSRMGWGRWTVIDQDTLLPHNVARHRLGEIAVGAPKVAAINRISAIETPHNTPEKAFLADALAVQDNEEMLAAYRTADLILDVSTSIAVPRFLAIDLDSTARRASLFVNPVGRDIVMLMEDDQRTVTLDAIEPQYYRMVLSDERLEEHINRQPEVRYGAGCRDVTTRVAQDDIALASGLLCRQVRTVGENAIARVWQGASDGSLRTIEIPIAPVHRYECDGWGFVLDEAVIDRAARYRLEQLPNETGGILIGYFDVPRKCVYVVDALPAPSDSVQHEQAFIRGYAGLPEKLAMIDSRSGGQVGYIGEWHSHPHGASVGMSPDDAILLAAIAEEVRADGWPGVMMIVGEGGSVGFFTLAI